MAKPGCPKNITNAPYNDFDNIKVDTIEEKTYGHGVVVDDIIHKDGDLYTNAGSIRMTQDPLINGSEVYITPTSAGLKRGVDSSLALNNNFNLHTVGMGSISTTDNLTIQSGSGNITVEAVNGDITVEAPAGAMDVDVLGDIDVNCSNFNVGAASFGGLATSINGAITFMNSTNFNVSAGTTTDFASGSTVDFTGATVTGLPSSSGFSIDAGSINISSTGSSSVSGLSFQPKLVFFNWRSGTKTGNTEARSSWGYYCTDGQFLALTFTNGSGNIHNSSETAYCYGITNLAGDSILGTVSSFNSDGFTMNTTVFSGYTLENFSWLAFG